AVLAFDVDVKESVRIHPLDLRHDAGQLDRAVRVELCGKRMMSCGMPGYDKGAECHEQRGGFRSHRSNLHVDGRNGRSPKGLPKSSSGARARTGRPPRASGHFADPSL